ncbi:NPP1 family protein [Streptomyces sp. NPDC051555]|uniref:NPP1 family protein n=1 Tax=Streptomyces sp. NPDC051555 TaxID=3365657 RepID=UPI0037A8C471
MTLPALASADVLPSLPQDADGLEQTFSPAYDYDRDGCYATAAISGDGRLNPGLKLGGDVNGHCRDAAQLQNSNTYAREKCDNGWCAVMYASYFEKDQATLGPAAIGHRHDFEHVVVWIKDNQVQYVSTSQHSGWKWYPRSAVRFDGTHPKAVYHKDGASTHFFRLANSNDEPPENHTGGWFHPRLVGWNGYPAGLRDKLMNADFGAATIKITDGRFGDALNAAKPPIPFNAYS